MVAGDRAISVVYNKASLLRSENVTALPERACKKGTVKRKVNYGEVADWPVFCPLLEATCRGGVGRGSMSGHSFGSFTVSCYLTRGSGTIGTFAGHPSLVQIYGEWQHASLQLQSFYGHNLYPEQVRPGVKYVNHQPGIRVPSSTAFFSRPFWID